MIAVLTIPMSPLFRQNPSQYIKLHPTPLLLFILYMKAPDRSRVTNQSRDEFFVEFSL